MEKDYIHKVYPRKLERTDFWGQIKRTVNGRPVSEEEIDLIVNQIVSQLEIKRYDNLLDLGCGNAALSSRIFGMLDKYTGVDFSEYLIGIANEYFRVSESIDFKVSDILAYVKEDDAPQSFSKVLCYGAMTYISKIDFITMMRILHDRFTNVERIFIGNIPERSKAKEFYSKRGVTDYQLDDPGSAIGVWWGQDEIIQAMEDIGYKPIISRMPESFYTASYRFDITLLVG